MAIEVYEILSSDDEDEVMKKPVVTTKRQPPEVIDLMSSDEEDSPVKLKRLKRTPLEDVTNKEVEEVAPPKVTVKPAVAVGDDDVQVVGHSGANALEDFPHGREHCVQFPWARDPRKFCSNCYCVLCDEPVSKCFDWATHSRIKYGGPNFKTLKSQAQFLKKQRQAGTTQPQQQQQQQPQKKPQSSFSRLLSLHSQPTHETWRPRDLLRAITKVLPAQAPQPVAITTDLRHYQKQSLYFMVELERGPPTSTDTNLGGNLRSGFLCSEVGMGKSCTVLALVAANPMRNPPDKDDAVMHIRNGSQQRLVLKGTVIFTSVSLMGQWEDECKTHAPSLRVFRYHTSNRAVGAGQGNISFTNLFRSLANADVIISSTTFNWNYTATERFQFHRVVHDESHLFSKGASCNVGRANSIYAGRRWAVTATPCVDSMSELSAQLRFLGLYSNTDFSKIMSSYTTPLNQAAELLGKYMVRHTKSQRIGGDVALALPDATTTTIFLDMTLDERILYDYSIRTLEYGDRVCAKNYLKRGGRATHLQNTLTRVLGACGNSYSDHFANCSAFHTVKPSKFNALRQDLARIRQSNPAIHAVVFTAHASSHATIVAMLRQDNFLVSQITGGTAAATRDNAIRRFQNEDSNRASVFVVTIRAGAVGMTLTAASKVYIMEPMIDPAMEIQAAGRIHRLGQTKAVTVTRFAFNNSIEENIIKVHALVKAKQLTVDDGELTKDGMAILLKGLDL